MISGVSVVSKKNSQMHVSLSNVFIKCLIFLMEAFNEEEKD